jgi:hypothetical protein
MNLLALSESSLRLINPRCHSPSEITPARLRLIQIKARNRSI